MFVRVVVIGEVEDAVGSVPPQPGQSCVPVGHSARHATPEPRPLHRDRRRITWTRDDAVMGDVTGEDLLERRTLLKQTRI